MRAINLVIALFFIFCYKSPITQNDWKSSYRNLSFQYSPPFTFLPPTDTEAQTLAGIIDFSDGKSCVIKMTRDLPKDQVSNEKLYRNAKEIMLAENTENKLISESDTTFHSHTAHKMIFLMNTKKWGRMNQISYISRNGKDYFSIQIMYPYRDTINTIPELLDKFQKHIKINEP